MQRKTSRTRGLLLREQHRHDASSAQAFKDQRAFFSREQPGSLQGPEGFFCANSIDTTQVQRKPSRTSGLLFCEQPRHDTRSAQAFKDELASSSRAAFTRHKFLQRCHNRRSDALTD